MTRKRTFRCRQVTAAAVKAGDRVEGRPLLDAGRQRLKDEGEEEDRSGVAGDER